MGLTNLYQQLAPAAGSSCDSAPASPDSANAANNKEDDGNGNVKVPIYLNVYDLTTYNAYAYWFGLGIFHSAVEVHGVEYAFGAHEFPTSGVFEVEPRKCPGFTFRRSIQLGSTTMGPLQVRQFMESVAAEYNGDTYHLLLKNCNHFTDDISRRLTSQSIPGWVNRLARIGWLCRCFLPECLQLTAGQQMSELEEAEECADGKDVLGSKKSGKDVLESKKSAGEEERLLSDEAIKSLLLQESVNAM